MGDERETNEREREQLQAGLADERAALLAVVSGVGEEALTRPTRNPDWAVRDVLAHVLASDADLILVLEEAARPRTGDIRMPGFEGHQEEMARGAEATPSAFVQELRERGNRWRGLMSDLRGPSWALPVLGHWWPQGAVPDSTAGTLAEAGISARPLAPVVADWRGHDAQHAEDVRLALADGPSR